jgi:hypothetical protein
VREAPSQIKPLNFQISISSVKIASGIITTRSSNNE